MDDYIHLFRPGIWESVISTSSALGKRRRKGLLALKADVERYDPTKPIALRTDVNLGQYDTDRKWFPVEKLTPKTF